MVCSGISLSAMWHIFKQPHRYTAEQAVCRCTLKFQHVWPIFTFPMVTVDMCLPITYISYAGHLSRFFSPWVKTMC